ncbi:hypothetical protein Airi02_064190 [Actinoallomurus iriomotensis]|uniref:Uncharacterized protein n=1 Tax=Actinoallomurus iriomotensis TaxID=478107 RepID=A0A9W6W216_9ACTN|nr:hypothetical protein Airi02_064190 [Actinoallomurus iriomotensis]
MDTNADHLAAWRLDEHGNPCGEPLRFFYDLSGDAQHRDAQIRHALTRLLQQKPTATSRRKTTRHDAAGIAIGRRALGHRIRRRTAPPHDDRSDRRGYRTAQAAGGTRGREGTRPRIPGPRTRSAGAGYGANAGDQDAQHRSERPTEPVQLMLSR